jgi:hypothetical protein
MNLENAVRGARNPLNSWELCDSYYDGDGNYVLGPKDISLASRLCSAGSDHRKFVRQIFVCVDITAPLYWWKEFDTYKVSTAANSTSTMHKIHAKEFALSDFSCERMDADTLETLKTVINVLEKSRLKYLETNEKQYWENMIQLLPSSYNQLRTVTMNYENLINMFRARSNHKLKEWHDYCDWIKTLLTPTF